MKSLLKPLQVSHKAVHLLPVFISFILAGFLIAIYKMHDEAISFSLGVIAGGLTDIDHRITGKLKYMILTLSGFTICSIMVQLSLDHSYLIILLLTAIAFFTTLLGCVDERYRTIAFTTLLVALYILLTRSETLNWYTNPLMIVLGGTMYHVISIVIHLIFPNHPVQESIANSFQVLCRCIQTKARFFSPDELDDLAQIQYALVSYTQNVTAAFNHTRDILFSRISGHKLTDYRKIQLQDFFIAQDIHERIGASHVNYKELNTQLQNSDLPFRIERLLSLQGRACRDYAYAISHQTTFTLDPQLARAYEGLKRSLAVHRLAQQDIGLQRLVDNLGEINRQISRLGTVPDSLHSPTLGSSHAHHLSDIYQRIKNNLSIQSPFFRHAVRMAGLTFLTCSIVELWHITLGYWIVLTAIIVCQPNKNATQKRLYQRVAGTVVGVIAGTILPEMGFDANSMLALMVISSCSFFYFRFKNYGITSFFITLEVFSSFGYIGLPSNTALIDRLVDTVIGAGTALAFASFIWPDWKFISTGKVIKGVIQANRDYLRLILEQLRQDNRDDISYRIARRRVHESVTALTQVETEMRLYSDKYQDRIMLTNRFIQANHQVVSQLATLGVYRGRVPDNEQPYLDQIIHAGEQVLALLDQMKDLDTPNFQHTVQGIIADVEPLPSVMGRSVLRCTQQLVPYYAIIQDLNAFDNQATSASLT